MKKIILSLFVLLIPFLSFSQKTTEVRLSAHGGWFLPVDKELDNDKNGFTTGATCSLELPVWKAFSLMTGIGYEYKQMKTSREINVGGSPYSYNPYPTVHLIWEKIPQHYVLLPVKLRLQVAKALFLQGGLEMGWLVNYKSRNEKTEYNWCVGLGNNKHRLHWTIEYVKGFKEQGFGKQNSENPKSAIYTNQQVRLCLSYPLWTKKK